MTGDAHESPAEPAGAGAPTVDVSSTSHTVQSAQAAVTHEAVTGIAAGPYGEPLVSAIAASSMTVAAEAPVQLDAATTSAVAHTAAEAVVTHSTQGDSLRPSSQAGGGDAPTAAPTESAGTAPAAPGSTATGPASGVRRIMIGSQRERGARPAAPRHHVGGGGSGGSGKQGGPKRGPRPPRHEGPQGRQRPEQVQPAAQQPSLQPSDEATTDAAGGEGPVAPPAALQAPREQHREPRQPRPRRESTPQGHETPQVTVPKPTRQTAAEVEEEVLAELAGVEMEDVLAGGAAAGDELLEPQTRLQAPVVAIHQDNVFVDLRSRHQGVLAMKQFAEPPAVGDVLDVVVQSFDPDEGLYQLARCDAPISGAGEWSQLSEGMLVEARVTGHNKGGLELEVGSLRAFMPASHASLYRVEDLSTMVGEKFTCLVTEVNPRRRRLILSRRAVLEREKQENRDKLRAEIKPGQEREGVVRSVMDFGAFVDMGGIDGLVHVSQLSWQRVQHPSEVLQVGQRVKVRVTKVSAETGKISLSVKDLIENPWAAAAAKYPAHSKVTGTVSRIAEFGAFVQLEPGVEGLVHISELAHHRVPRVSDVVQEGQTVECQVLAVDSNAQRISLSIRALTPKPESANRREREEPETPAPPPRPASKKPLKGGVGRPTGGEAFGLKW